MYNVFVPVVCLYQRERQQSVPSVCTRPSLQAVAVRWSQVCTVLPLCVPSRKMPAATVPSLWSDWTLDPLASYAGVHTGHGTLLTS